jgi:hypothetical protein
MKNQSPMQLQIQLYRPGQPEYIAAAAIIILNRLYWTKKPGKNMFFPVWAIF